MKLLLALLLGAPPALDLTRAREIERAVPRVGHGRYNSLDHGSGTAFLVGTSGDSLFFVTNAHVVSHKDLQGNRIPGAVLNGPGWVSDSKIVAVDEALDLALLRVDRFRNENLATTKTYLNPHDLKPLTTGAPLTANSGVWLAGYSYGTVSPELAFTHGKVLRLVPEPWVSARASPGNSGGPALNERLELVGVLCAGLVGAKQNENQLIPIATLRSFLNSSDAGVLTFAPLPAPAAELPPTGFAPECLISIWRGTRLTGFAYPVDRAGAEVLLAGGRGPQWEYLTDAGLRRIDAPPEGVAPPGWVCADGVRPSVDHFAQGRKWAPALPSPWSPASEARLRPASDFDQLWFDSEGRVGPAFVHSIAQSHFRSPQLTWNSLGDCKIEMNLAAPGIPLRGHVRVELLDGPSTEKDLDIPAEGLTFTETISGCDQPKALTLIRVRLTEPAFSVSETSFGLTTELVRPRRGGNSFFGRPSMETSQLVRLPRAKGMPHYLCDDGLIDARTGQKLPLRGSAHNPIRLPAGVVVSGQDLVATGEGFEPTRIWNMCPTKVAWRSPSDSLNFEWSPISRVRGDAGVRLREIVGEPVAIRATPEGYQVAVQKGQEHVSLFSVGEGTVTLRGRYDGGLGAGACVLTPDDVLWCRGGPVVLEGRKAPDAGALGRCSPIVEACPDFEALAAETAKPLKNERPLENAQPLENAKPLENEKPTRCSLAPASMLLVVALSRVRGLRKT